MVSEYEPRYLTKTIRAVTKYDCTSASALKRQGISKKKI